MANPDEGALERKPSHKSSHHSSSHHHPGTIRTRSRKHSLVTPGSGPNSAKSLTSFPSLSPEDSPSQENVSLKKGPSSPSPSALSALRRPSAARSPNIVESLMRRSSSIRRPLLFEESPKHNRKDVPGALHLASEDLLHQTIQKHGAANLVRHLAENIADRDAELTRLKSRAEERERELRKMLRDAQVSNQRVDERLNGIDRKLERARSTQDLRPRTNHTTAGGLLITSTNASGIGIDQMMGEAMRENVGTVTESEEEEARSMFPTPEISRKSSRTSVSGPRKTVSSPRQDNGTKRGWKNYFFTGDGYDTKVRPSGTARRKGLDDDLFNPIYRASTTPSSQHRLRESSVRSRKSSNSVSSWTLKLFGGNQSGGQDTIRGRSSTTSSNKNINDIPTTALQKEPSSAKAALLRVSSKDVTTRTTQRSVPPLPLGLAASAMVKKQPVPTSAALSPRSTGDPGLLGPVEMETILPPESRPPTDQLYNLANPTDHLVDRFGFIYDGRRRKREAQALDASKGKDAVKMPGAPMKSRRESIHTLSEATSSHSQASSVSQPHSPISTEDASETPPRRWQDHLKVATYPTELLSHTPVAHSLATVIDGDQSQSAKQSPVFRGSRGLPTTGLNLEAAASPMAAENNERITMTEDNLIEEPLSKTDMEPVRLLLKQLTELHDSLQHERSIRWNEFLRKVRAERQKEGDSLLNQSDSRSKTAAATPEASLIDGSLIGISNFGNKGKVGLAKWKEFKSLVLAGIPVAYRAKIWSESSGASSMDIPEYYVDLIKPYTNGEANESTDDPAILAQIEMDIHRTMTDNVFFRSGPGVSKLKEVLLAYSRRNPEVGYCQGMNLIAASLLLIMPTPEAAFWMLCAIIEQILPTGYFAPPLIASRADSIVLRGYVRDILPSLSKHLEDLNIDLEALTFQWFLSLFTDCLSAEALFRVWDVIFCTCSTEGSTFLFQLALALLKLNEKDLLKCQTSGDVYWYLGNKVTDHAVGIDGLVRASEGLGKVVKRADVEARREDALSELKRQMGGPQGNVEERRENGLLMQEPRPVEE